MTDDEFKAAEMKALQEEEWSPEHDVRTCPVCLRLFSPEEIEWLAHPELWVEIKNVKRKREND